MQITLNALFNKHTRDSKKESMTFYIKGGAEAKPELQELHRSVVQLRIKDVDASVSGEFKKLNRDDKKTTIEFEIKGGTSLDSSGKFFAKSGTDVELSIEGTNEDVEKFREKQKEYRKGLKGKINPDGTAELEHDPNQGDLFDDDPMSELDEEDDFEPAEDPDSDDELE